MRPLPSGTVLLLCASSFGWDLADVSRIAWSDNPRLSEDSSSLLLARNRLEKVKYGAILPRFELGVAYGPAPGFSYSVNDKGDSTRSYQWWPMGPYFGSEIRLAQPLNVHQLRSGLSAARSGIEVERIKLEAKRQDYLREAAEYYFGYVYARQMRDLLEPALRKLDRADSTMQAKLDNDDEDASQSDLLQLRSSRYAADKGMDEAITGMERAEKGLRFVLKLSPTDPLPVSDLELYQLSDLPGLDTMRAAFAPSDLRLLQAGIKAKQSLVELQKAQMGPTIAIFADLSYTKAWVANRNRQNKDVLITDPINSLGGKFGLGFSWELNFWAKRLNYREAQLDVEALRRKEVYAQAGLDSKFSESYARYASSNRRVKYAQRARDAADSWLKAVALQVDADSSREKELISPYQRYLDLQHEYLDAVYQRNLRILEVLGAASLLTPDRLTRRPEE